MLNRHMIIGSYDHMSALTRCINGVLFYNTFRHQLALESCIRKQRTLQRGAPFILKRTLATVQPARRTANRSACKAQTNKRAG